jgi:hypothetical protein
VKPSSLSVRAKKDPPRFGSPWAGQFFFNMVVVWFFAITCVMAWNQNGRSESDQGLSPHDDLLDVAIREIGILRKEVIQPQVPLRLPCYDLVPIAEFILGA